MQLKSLTRKKKASAEPAPGTLTPYPYQEPIIQAHIRAFKRGQRRRHEGSDMGSGKTYIASFIAKRMKKKLGVICPKTARSTWKKAAELVGVEIAFVVNYESLTVGNKYRDVGTFPERDKVMAEYAERILAWETRYSTFLADNPDATAAEKLVLKQSEPKRPIIEDKTFVFDPAQVNDDLIVIVDEAHRCKGEDSLTAELLVALAAQDILAMSVSATPAISPADMRALGYFLGLHNLTDFVHWAVMRSCVRTRFGKLQHVGGTESCLALNREIYPKKGCRISIDDLPKGSFPDVQITADAYDMGSQSHREIVAAYDEFHEQLARWEAGMSTIKGMNPLVLMLRLRQRVEMAKVPAFVEMAKDAVASGKRVLIFVSFKETIWELAKLLNTNCLYYGGNVREREKHLANFQANKKGCEVMILNVAAGAESISAHDLMGGHQRLSLISPTWSAYKMQQAFGRTRRGGGKSKALVRMVFAAKTIEEKVSDNVKDKMRKMSALQDGDLISEHLQGFLDRNPEFQKAIDSDSE